MIKAPQCFACIHYQEGLKCAAFDRIPKEILINRVDHRQSYPGDGGITFESNEVAKAYDPSQPRWPGGTGKQRAGRWRPFRPIQNDADLWTQTGTVTVNTLDRSDSSGTVVPFVAEKAFFEHDPFSPTDWYQPQEGYLFADAYDNLTAVTDAAVAEYAPAIKELDAQLKIASDGMIYVPGGADTKVSRDEYWRLRLVKERLTNTAENKIAEAILLKFAPNVKWEGQATGFLASEDQNIHAMASSHWALSQKAELANSLGVNNAVVWDFLNSDRYWVGYTGNTVQDMDVPGGHNENATAVEYPTSQREAIVHIANLRLQGAGVLASIHPGMVATDHVLAQFDPFDAPGAVKHDRMIMVQGKENKPDYDAKVYKDRVIVGEVQRKVLVEGATGKQRMALRLEGRDDWQEDWKVRASMGFTAMGGMGEFSVTADVRVVAHEIGHYLEDSNTALQGAVQNMIVDRAVKLPGSPEFKTIKLSETSDYYREDEIVYEFKPGREFITPYAQKMYSSYKVNGVQMHASEVISSGVEWMFTKPLQFAMKDREHFNLIARAMLGDPTLMDRKGKESVIPLP